MYIKLVILTFVDSFDLLENLQTVFVEFIFSSFFRIVYIYPDSCSQELMVRWRCLSLVGSSLNVTNITFIVVVRCSKTYQLAF